MALLSWCATVCVCVRVSVSIDKVNVAVSCRASVSCFPLCFFHLQATDECHSKTRPTAALLSWIRHASPSWHLITLHCQRIQMRPAGGHAVPCRAMPCGAVRLTPVALAAHLRAHCGPSSTHWPTHRCWPWQLLPRHLAHLRPSVTSH